MYSCMRRVSRLERLYWRLHVYFGYLAYKSMFGESSAKKWKQTMLDCIDDSPVRFKADESAFKR